MILHIFKKHWLIAIILYSSISFAAQPQLQFKFTIKSEKIDNSMIKFRFELQQPNNQYELYVADMTNAASAIPQAVVAFPMHYYKSTIECYIRFKNELNHSLGEKTPEIELDKSVLSLQIDDAPISYNLLSSMVGVRQTIEKTPVETKKGYHSAFMDKEITKKISISVLDSFSKDIAITLRNPIAKTMKEINPVTLEFEDRSYFESNMQLNNVILPVFKLFPDQLLRNEQVWDKDCFLSLVLISTLQGLLNKIKIDFQQVQQLIQPKVQLSIRPNKITKSLVSPSWLNFSWLNTTWLKSKFESLGYYKTPLILGVSTALAAGALYLAAKYGKSVMPSMPPSWFKNFNAGPKTHAPIIQKSGPVTP